MRLRSDYIAEQASGSRKADPVRAVLCLGLLTLAVGCGEQQAAQPPTGRPPAPVRVMQVAQQEVQRTVVLVGSVEPWKRSVVASEIDGLVKSFPSEEGRAVKKGQVLAELREDTLQIRLDSALASHREAVARYRQARLDLDRVQALFTKELVTKKEYDDAVAQEGASRERVAQLEAEIRQVRDQLAKTKIMAPFDGWITKEYTEVGQWVEAGGSVVEMLDLSRVKIDVPLPERYVKDVHVNDAVSVTFDGLPGFEAKGHVFSVVAQADRVSRTFPVKVEVQNPDLKIKSGMVARLTLVVGKPYQATVVPKDALVLRGDKEYVFFVKDGTANQLAVTSLAHFDRFIEVEGDVHPGMMVVVAGNERLLPGQTVRILDEATLGNGRETPQAPSTEKPDTPVHDAPPAEPVKS